MVQTIYHSLIEILILHNNYQLHLKKYKNVYCLYILDAIKKSDLSQLVCQIDLNKIVNMFSEPINGDKNR